MANVRHRTQMLNRVTKKKGRAKQINAARGSIKIGEMKRKSGSSRDNGCKNENVNENKQVMNKNIDGEVTKGNRKLTKKQRKRNQNDLAHNNGQEFTANHNCTIHRIADIADYDSHNHRNLNNATFANNNDIQYAGYRNNAAINEMKSNEMNKNNDKNTNKTNDNDKDNENENDERVFGLKGKAWVIQFKKSNIINLDAHVKDLAWNEDHHKQPLSLYYYFNFQRTLKDAAQMNDLVIREIIKCDQQGANDFELIERIYSGIIEIGRYYRYLRIALRTTRVQEITGQLRTQLIEDTRHVGIMHNLLISTFCRMHMDFDGEITVKCRNDMNSDYIRNYQTGNYELNEQMAKKELAKQRAHHIQRSHRQSQSQNVQTRPHSPSMSQATAASQHAASMALPTYTNNQQNNHYSWNQGANMQAPRQQQPQQHGNQNQQPQHHMVMLKLCKRQKRLYNITLSNHLCVETNSGTKNVNVF